jgi:hypothetical protein
MKFYSLVFALIVTTVMSLRAIANEPGHPQSAQDQGNTNSDATSIASSNSSCCGQAKHFIWERYVKGVMVDSDWIIGVPGSTIYDVYNKGDRVIKVALSMPPYVGEAGPPKLTNGTRYYDGRFPGLATITAEGVDGAWETWRFTYDEYEIIDAEGYIAGQTYDVSVRSELKGQWDQEWNLSYKDGGWVALSSSSNAADLLFGPPGSQLEEIDPELQGLGWTEVNLPSGLGYFFGRSHAVGELWTVTVNGQTSSARVISKDPDAVGMLE